MGMQKTKKCNRTDVLLLAAYTVLTVTLLLFHEPWRDEAQQWLFVKNQGFLSMLSHLHYEGHPALWYLLIWPLTRLGLGYFSVFVLHAAIVLFCGWLILFRSPFRWYLKFLFLFGYAFGYEYNAVARSYILACTLLFLIAAVFPERHGKYTAVYGILLILLINTHVFAALAAIALVIYDFFFLLSRRIPRKGFFKNRLVRSSLAVFAFFVLGLLLICLTLRGERDFYAGSPVSLSSLIKTNYVTASYRLYYLGMNSQLWTRLAYLFPSLTYSSSSFLTPWGKALGIYYIVIGISLIALLLYRFKTAFLVTMYCGMLAVASVIGAPINYFHACLIFAFYVFALWISKTTPDEFSSFDRKWTGFVSRLRVKKVNVVALLASIALITNTGVAALSVCEEIRYPYSQAKAAADFIMDNGYDTPDTSLVTPSIAKTTAVLAYLKNIRALTLPGWPEPVSYSTWDKTYMDYQPSDGTIFDFARSQYRDYGKTPLVIFCVGGQDDVPEDFMCIFDSSDTKTFNADEKYCIYTLRP